MAERAWKDRTLSLHYLELAPKSPDRMEAFRELPELDVDTILRRPVVADEATLEDWAALFCFALGFDWDTALIPPEGWGAAPVQPRRVPVSDALACP